MLDLLFRRVDRFLQLLQESSGGPDEQGLREHTKDFCREMRDHALHLGRFAGGGASPVAFAAVPGQPGSPAYEALRRSLAAAQHRCASMSEEMLQVADTNEELLASLRAEKGTHKGLMKGLHRQGEEMAEITRTRLRGESQVDDVARRQAAEVEVWEQDLGAQLRSIEAEHDALLSERKLQFAERFKQLQAALRTLQLRAGDLRQSHSATAAGVKGGLADWHSDAFVSFSQRLSDRLSEGSRLDARRLSQLKNSIHATLAKFQVEREAREQEAREQEVRDLQLVAESEHTASHTEAEMARLRSELEAAEGAREAEAQSLERDLGSSTERLTCLAAEVTALELAVEASRGSAAVLEERCQQGDQKQVAVGSQLQEVSAALRKADEALDEALEHNEGKRRQLEALRSEAQARCHKAAREYAERCDCELAQLLEQQRSEVHGISERLQHLEVAAADQAAQVSNSDLEAQRLRGAHASLRREHSYWEAQEEVGAQLCSAAGRDLAEAQSEWGRQLQALRSERGALLARHQVLGEELRSAAKSCTELDRSSSCREHEARARFAALDAGIYQAHEELGISKRQLTERSAALSTTRTAATSERAAMLEAQDQLETQLRVVAQEGDEARKRLAERAAVERRRAEEARRDREEAERHGRDLLQDSSSGPLRRLSALEGEVQDLLAQQQVRSQKAALDVDAQRKKINSVEIVLNRVQEVLNETDGKVLDEVAQLQEFRERRLRSAGGRWRGAATATAAAAEPWQAPAKLEALQREHSQALAAAQGRMRDELALQRRALQDAEEENQRLQQSLSGVGRNPSCVPDVDMGTAGRRGAGHQTPLQCPGWTWARGSTEEKLRGQPPACLEPVAGW